MKTIKQLHEVRARDLLERMQERWSTGNAKAVAQCFCHDGMYLSSIGPLPGGSAIGRDAIERLVAEMMETDSGARSTTTDLMVLEQGAFWKWRYDHPDGQVTRGCDHFQFRDGLIASKDAYRKLASGTEK